MRPASIALLPLPTCVPGARLLSAGKGSASGGLRLTRFIRCFQLRRLRLLLGVVVLSDTRGRRVMMQGTWSPSPGPSPSAGEP